MPDSLRRLAPLTGIIYAACLVVAFVTPGSPNVHDSGAQVLAHYKAHHSAHQLGDGFGALGVLFFIFFITTLRSYFRDREGGNGLATAALVGGIFIAMGGAIFTSLDWAVADARNSLTPAAAQAINVLSNDFFWPFEIGLVAFSLTIGLAVIATGALPKWLGWVAVVIGIVGLTPVGFFGFFALMLWSVIVAILIFLRTAGKAGSPAAGQAGISGQAA